MEEEIIRLRKMNHYLTIDITGRQGSIPHGRKTGRQVRGRKSGYLMYSYLLPNPPQKGVYLLSVHVRYVPVKTV